MTILTLGMKLRRMASLPRVLMLCQRLGAEVTYLSAAEGSANLVLAAPAGAAHPTPIHGEDHDPPAS